MNDDKYDGANEKSRATDIAHESGMTADRMHQRVSMKDLREVAWR
jgi:hypothetical protein